MGETVYALVTGGGTGGHVYPALAVADELARRGHARESLRFVGSRRGLEASAVPEAGYAIDLLGGRGVRRSLSPRAIVTNVLALAGAFGAFVMSLRIVGQRRPRVVFGVGGYASAACVMAARLRRVPAVVHEQNAAPGLVNRLAVRFGARAAVSLPGTPLRDAVLTGNPVRAAITEVERAPDVRRPLVVIIGGSLGAESLNHAALELYDRWRDRVDLAVRHVTGRRNHESVSARLSELRRSTDMLAYDLRAYEEDMPETYAHASVFVCRAGAVTCAELTATGTPALLVPLPGAPADHQTRNADTLAAAGAALVVPDSELDGARLGHELGLLLADPVRLRTMGDAASALGRPDATDRVADLVEETAAALVPSEHDR